MGRWCLISVIREMLFKYRTRWHYTLIMLTELSFNYKPQWGYGIGRFIHGLEVMKWVSNEVMKLVIMSHDQLGHTQFIVWSVMLSISFTIINFVFFCDSTSLKEKKIICFQSHNQCDPTLYYWSFWPCNHIIP